MGLTDAGTTRSQGAKVDVYNINAILSAVNGTRDDVEPTNGECLVAFVELIRQALEPLSADDRRPFIGAIAAALALDDVHSFSHWLGDRDLHSDRRSERQ